MDYPVDINLGVAIWVEESRPDYVDYSRCWRLHGTTFDDWWGFGDEFTTDYSGEVALISRTSKSIRNLEIGRYHSNRKSWGWYIETEELPAPPFLITNKLDACIIFDGLIELELTQDGEEIFEDSYEGNSFPVMSRSGWFGILTDKVNAIHLLAFSEQENQEIVENSYVMRAGRDWALGKMVKCNELQTETFKTANSVMGSS